MSNILLYYLLLAIIISGHFQTNDSLQINGLLKSSFLNKKESTSFKNFRPLFSSYINLEVDKGILNLLTSNNIIGSFIDSSISIEAETYISESINLSLVIILSLVIGYSIYVNDVKKSPVLDYYENTSIQVENTNANFIFDDKDEYDNGKDFSYLYSGILAGLNYLPSEKALKNQIGFGRRVQYEKYQLLSPKWRNIGNINNKTPFESVSAIDINRFIDTDDVNNEEQVGSFRIYKMKIKRDIYEEINKEIISKALLVESQPSVLRLNVSNAGGYHSNTDLFYSNSDGNNNPFSEIAESAVLLAEEDDFKISSSIFKSFNEKSLNLNKMNRLRSFESSNESEAWVNINRHGNWNRLHTHKGSSWSGIYYIRTPPEDCLSENYSGRLLLKPSPHITEYKYDLTTIELARLNGMDKKYYNNQINKQSISSVSCCDFLEIQPIVGEIIIIPGWLQHAVYPLNVKPNFRYCNNEGTRISLAFNFVETLR